MSTIDDLVARQSHYMGSIRRALANFKKLGQAKMTSAITHQRLGTLKEIYAKCQELDAEILVRTDHKIQSSHPYFTEERFLSCEEAFNEAADFMAEIISRTDQVQTKAAAASDLPGTASTRLPKLRLPSFDGSFDKWETFRDKFTSLIINDVSLTNVDRMHYLSSCITGDASNALTHLAVTDSNFPVAWKILSSRYENKRRLIAFHIHALHNLPIARSETFQNLRDLSDKVNASIQALLNLDRPVKEWDDMLVYLVSEKLDPTTRKAWELHLGDSLDYPTFEQINRFLASRIRALEALPNVPVIKSKISSNANAKPERFKNIASHSANQESSRGFSSHTTTVSSACPVCRANHLIYQCDQFQNQTPSQRYTTIKSFKRCVNCFSAKHSVKDCTSARSCKQCGKKHHTLLHFSDNACSNSNDSTTSTKLHNNVTDSLASTHVLSKEENDVTDTHPTNHVNSKVTASAHSVLLATARIQVYAPTGHFIHARALLDQGSAITIITENLVQLLRLKKTRQSVRLSGVGDTGMTAHHAVQVQFSPADAPQPVFSTTAIVLKSLTKYAPQRVNSPCRWPHLERLNLADNDPMSSDPIDLLIGADLYGSLMLEGVRKGFVNQPIAQKTSLGWILSGPVSHPVSTLSVSTQHAIIWDTLSDDLRRFWEIEELSEQPYSTPDENQCEEHFAATHYRLPSGRYTVRLPFKADPLKALGESRATALCRFTQLERRLSRDLNQRTLYHDFIAEYLQLHHMEPSNPNTIVSSSRYYIPHHAVYKADSGTTPLRVVFNASSRTSTGKSLNDCLLIGPKLQNDLPSILIRWRHFRYVYIADSAKMYRQILLDPRDRDFQTILWRNAPTDPVAEYRLCTVTYGTAPAAYLAQRVLKQLGEDEGASYPLALPVLNRQMYVDDFIFGADDRHLALRTRDQLIHLLDRGGFRLRKWASNCQSLLTGIDPSDHGLAREKPFNGDESLKVLGIHWNPDSDTLKFRVRKQNNPGNSKRAILSAIARLFDPLGLVAPVVITAKMLMQKLWSIKCGWDEEVPPPLLREWMQFYSTLSALDNMALPRWTHHSSDTLQYSLHGFSDASSHAYAAV
ncbi:uncharacterized protein LOC123988861, partial [Osmia bicornis bicornis]|uniref:uncharacterized protein LOC123988861 n=1 Tax=Osmia bicornis bicornis TaxID=1437191 RepID=UPI001EAF7A59